MRKRKKERIKEKIFFILGVLFFMILIGFVGKQDLEYEIEKCVIYNNCNITQNTALSLLK